MTGMAAQPPNHSPEFAPDPDAPAGTAATVQGYVVGQPTGTSTVVTSGFPNDYELAVADTAGETDTADMLYVQIPSALRSSYGLSSDPGLMGDKIDVTGTVAPYFSHAGMKSVTAITGAGTEPDPDPSRAVSRPATTTARTGSRAMRSRACCTPSSPI